MKLKRWVKVVLVVLMLGGAFWLRQDIKKNNEERMYTLDVTVVECQPIADHYKIYAKDDTGNVWAYEHNKVDVGTKLVLTMDNRNTIEVEDDEIVKITIDKE